MTDFLFGMMFFYLGFCFCALCTIIHGAFSSRQKPKRITPEMQEHLRRFRLGAWQ
jgi:hypothetical protein